MINEATTKLDELFNTMLKPWQLFCKIKYLLA